MQPAEVERKIRYIGSSEKDQNSLPLEVRNAFATAITLANGGVFPPHAKPWKGEGGGVFEVRETHRSGTYRMIYTVRFRRSLYVLHCFQKKSPSGSETARRDVELVHDRLRIAEWKYYEEYREEN